MDAFRKLPPARQFVSLAPVKPTNSGESPAAVANGFPIGPEFSNIGAGGFSGAQRTLREVMIELQPAVFWPGLLPEGAARACEPVCAPLAISANL